MTKSRPVEKKSVTKVKWQKNKKEKKTMEKQEQPPSSIKTSSAETIIIKKVKLVAKPFYIELSCLNCVRKSRSDTF